MSPFSLLPQSCMEHIMMCTSPKDACRAAAVSLGFKSAAESDAVWERFLPPDYDEIIGGSTSPVVYSTKKELYFLFCDSPLLLDGGKLSFRLSRPTGKKCYLLCARRLQVAWIDTPVHWEWTSSLESRFGEVAELVSVCWLEIRGILQVQMLSPWTNYVAYLVFKLSENQFGLDCSSKASVKFVNEDGTEIEGETSTVYIVAPARRPSRIGRRSMQRQLAANVDGRLPRSRTDGWSEIKLGEFFIREGEKCDVHVQLSETEHLNWKKGLIVEGIELRPREAEAF